MEDGLAPRLASNSLMMRQRPAMVAIIMRNETVIACCQEDA